MKTSGVAYIGFIRQHNITEEEENTRKNWSFCLTSRPETYSVDKTQFWELHFRERMNVQGENFQGLNVQGESFQGLYRSVALQEMAAQISQERGTAAGAGREESHWWNTCKFFHKLMHMCCHLWCGRGPGDYGKIQAGDKAIPHSPLH